MPLTVSAPQSGDFVIYDWQGDEDPDHWAAVTEVEGDMLVIIEGNMADREPEGSLFPDVPDDA